MKNNSTSASMVLCWGLLLAAAPLAALAGTLIYLGPLPALWRMSWAYGLWFTLLGVMQLTTLAAVLARPERRRVLLAAAAALAVVGLWALARLARLLPAPDPWVPVNSVIGFTDDLCAGLQAFAALGLAANAAHGTAHGAAHPPAASEASDPDGGPHRPPEGLHFRPLSPRIRQVLSVLGMAPLAGLILLAAGIGIWASSNGGTGAGFPAGVVLPQNLPSGRMSTVEYCRPDRVPLAMDLYMPPAAAHASGAAPVVLYLHGGGALGDRKMYGASATLVDHAGALFAPLQQQLNRQGFVVAAIDYRLPPGTPWPAQIEDVKCAVRFLRAHSARLGIDPGRVGVWSNSGGGHLAAMLGLAGPQARFDRGQYADQSSAVQAVVDMFGAADLNDYVDSEPFGRFIVHLSVGGSTGVRRLASPVHYVASSAPPFLIIHGTDDPMVRPRQSSRLAQRLREAGVPVIFIEVQGTGHTLNTTGQQPSPDELVTTVVEFFVTQLQQP